MWRSIGSVSQQEPKSNRSKGEGDYEPFAQASKLKLNESQLSGQVPPPQFLNEYFVKKRSPDGMLSRVLSHKNLETRPFVSPPGSLKEVGSPRMRLKSEPNDSLPRQESTSLKEVPPFATKSFVASEKPIPKKQVTQEVAAEKPKEKDKGQESGRDVERRQQIAALRVELRQLRSQQSRLSQSVGGELLVLGRTMRQLQQQLVQEVRGMEREREEQGKKQGVNPQLLSKLRQQSSRFSDRMREIDARKEQVKQKYRSRMLDV